MPAPAITFKLYRESWVVICVDGVALTGEKTEDLVDVMNGPEFADVRERIGNVLASQSKPQ